MIYNIIFIINLSIEAQSIETTSVVTSITTSPSSYHTTNVSTTQVNVNNSDSVVNCVSTTPSSLSSTTSPVQVDSHSTLSSLKTMAQKAVDQAGIDITQESTDTKSNYNKLYAYIFSINPYFIQI